MRNLYTGILKDTFRIELMKFRTERNLTQARMSERIEMSERSYADIESGKSCCSAVTLVLYLVYCCDDVDGFLSKLKERMEKVNEDVA